MSSDWRDRALCREVDTDLFTPDECRGPLVDEAKAICDRCPSKTPCLEAALAEEGSAPAQMRASIRGGTTPRQRHAIHKRRQQAA